MNIQATNQVNLYSNVLKTQRQDAQSQPTQRVNTSVADVVSISAQAKELNLQPITPERPPAQQVNNKVQQYLDIQKSLAKVDAVENFTDDHFSVGEAYVAKNNETVRNAYLAKDKVQQTNEIADIMIDSIEQDDEEQETGLSY